MNKLYTLFTAFVLLCVVIACEKPFDYDDYETRYEYVENIRAEEFHNDSTLRILTWNIKVAMGAAINPWSEGIGAAPTLLDSMADYMLTLDPDIVLLQEVPLDRENNIVKKVLDSLAYHMDYNYAFGGHGFNSNGAYPTRAQWGNAILSKYKIEDIENREVFNLDDVWSRRSVFRALIQYKQNQRVNAYTLHWPHNAEGEEGVREIARLTRDFYGESPYPVIVGGDFNYSTSIDTILQLKLCVAQGFEDIDRVYVSDEFEPISFNYDMDALTYSDHQSGMAVVREE